MYGLPYYKKIINHTNPQTWGLRLIALSPITQLSAPTRNINSIETKAGQEYFEST